MDLYRQRAALDAAIAKLVAAATEQADANVRQDMADDAARIAALEDANAALRQRVDALEAQLAGERMATREAA